MATRYMHTKANANVFIEKPRYGRKSWRPPPSWILPFYQKCDFGAKVTLVMANKQETSPTAKHWQNKS